MTITTIIILIVIGLLAGILSGIVGIGGGLIMIPMMILFHLQMDSETQILEQ